MGSQLVPSIWKLHHSILFIERCLELDVIRFGYLMFVGNVSSRMQWHNHQMSNNKKKAEKQPFCFSLHPRTSSKHICVCGKNQNRRTKQKSTRKNWEKWNKQSLTHSLVEYTTFFCCECIQYERKIQKDKCSTKYILIKEEKINAKSI